MAACLQLNAKPLRTLFSPNPIFTKSTYKLGRIRCSAASPSKRYTITLLPGDGIGPEVISVAKNVLNLAATTQGIEFKYQEMPVGGNALDLTGVPLPEETLLATQQSDAVLLGAIGGYKWDKNEKHLKPETGLLKLREGLKVFANLRPAVVLHQIKFLFRASDSQLVDASSLKREIAEGVDLMVIRELTGGIYFGQPRGFGTNEDGEEIGFNTEVYAAYEIDRIARVAFETARKRNGKLCSVDKANVLEVEVCRILFTVDVQYTGSIEHAQSSSYSSTQQRPVCLGMHSKIHKEYFNVKIMIRLLLVILFFFLIFFYRETRPRLEWNSHNYLQSFFSLLLHIKMDRLFMAFVIHERCRNTQVLDAHEGDFVHYQFILGHAISKLRCKEAEHCYSLEMETRRDYAGDNYVHRLIQSKTDGKLVELNSHCRNANNVKGSCECVDSGFSEALLNSKVDTIVNEYNELLATQLEIQKTYFESLLQEVKEGTERKISKAVEKAVPLKKMQDKLDRCVKEKKFLYDLNVNLLKNREAWKTKIHEVEERERSASKLKDDKISSLEGQLRDLMLYLETWNAVERQSLSNETIDATILPVLINSLQPSMVR